MKLFVDTEWYDMIQDLPRDKQIEIMTAILAYPNGNSDTSVWQKVIRPKLDKSATLYTEKAQRLAENRKKRWHQTSEQISEQKSKQISVQKSNRYHDEEEDEKENVNENEDVNNPRDNTSGLTTTRTQQFNPPTLQQVLDYARMQNSVAGMGGFACTQELAEQFWSHYESIGWRVGNENRTPITNWQSKLRNWAAKDKQAPPPTSKESDKERKARENHEKIQKMLKGEQI